MSNLLTELVSKFDSGVKEVEGWVSEVKSHIPAVVAKAEEYEANPVVKAIEAAALPAEWVTLVTDFIARLGTLANSGSAPPAAVPPVAAVPADAAAPGTDTPIGDQAAAAAQAAPVQPIATPVG